MNDEDRDWIFPSDDPPSRADIVANTLAMHPGVYRSDAYGEAAVAFARLYDAVREPPMGPEALVCDSARGCLAMSSPEESRWVLTPIGRARIQREATAYRRSA